MILKKIHTCFTKLAKLFLPALLLSATENTLAGTAPPQTDSAIADGFNNFITKINTLTTTAIQQQDFASFIDFLFLFLVIILVVTTMSKYSMKVKNIADVFGMVILILAVKVMMVGYSGTMDAFWNLATGVAGSLQKGMVGTDDLFFAPKFLGSMMKSITFSGGGGWTEPFLAMKGALIVFFSSGLMMLLSMLSYVAAIWGFWGFQLAKLLGLLFVPTLLIERINFLFDGWLRFMIGFVVYYIVARLNLVMVACALAMYAGVGLPPTPTSSPVEFPDIQSVFEVYGLLTFTLVGLLALFSTGKFAATIVGGAGGGGMGSAVMGATRLAGKVAAGL